MPTLFNGSGYVIAMYFEDHNPPHVHVVGKEFEALIRIDDLSLLRGSLQGKARHEALKWIEENRELLNTRWAEWH